MEQLGIEPKLLLAQIINFSIIIFVLTKLLYTPILSMLEKRKKEIEQGLALTQKMKDEEEKLIQRREKQLTETRRQAQQIIEEAKKHGSEREREIITQAHQEAAEIITKGKHEAQRLLETAGKNIQKEAIELAVAMTKRLVRSVLSPADQHKLIQKHLKQLEQ